MPITRDSTGLLFQDNFDRADGALGANWTAIAGTWTVTTNRVRNAPGADHERIIASVLAARGDMVVQAKLVPTTGGTFPGLFGRWDQAGEHGYLVNMGGAADDVVQLYRRQSGTFTQIGGNAAVALTAGTAVVAKLLTLTSVQRLWIDTVLKLDLADTALNAVTGKAGFRTGYSGGTTIAHYDDFVVCSANTVSCSGLPTGWKIRVGTIVATESAGTATLDLAGTTLPAAQLEVLDAADAVQDTFATVWGGDAFSYASANVAPDTPTITVSEVGTTTAVLTSSAFSDTNAVSTHAASQWQVDEDAGDFSIPVVDSGTDAVNLLSYEAVGLPDDTLLKARVRHQDDGGLWSDWSAPVTFQTLFAVPALPKRQLPSSTLWHNDEAVAVPGDYEPAIMASEPDLYWRLNEAEGEGTAQDNTTNNRDVVVPAGHTFGAQGLLGGSARSMYIAPGSAQLEYETSWIDTTVDEPYVFFEFWIKLMDVTTRQTILTIATEFELFVEAGKIWARNFYGGGSNLLDGGVIAANTNYQVGYMRVLKKYMHHEIYIDGAVRAEVNSGGAINIGGTGNPLKIGSFAADTWLDEFSLFNYLGERVAVGESGGWQGKTSNQQFLDHWNARAKAETIARPSIPALPERGAMSSTLWA